jgi:hypothetical protein
MAPSVNTPKYVGFHEDADLPVKRGDTVTIPKGTHLRTTHPQMKDRVAARTYRVKVDHILPGSTDTKHEQATEPPYHFIVTKVPLTNPSVRWAGTGGYWFEADLNDIPEAR